MTDHQIRRVDEPITLTVDGSVDTPRTVLRETGPVRRHLDAVSPTGDADHVTVHSGDGLFTASIPFDVVAAASIGDDGRLRIDRSPTRCWLVKDVRRLELTVGPRPDSLPPEERAKL